MNTRVVDGHYWSEVWDHVTPAERMNPYQHIGRVRSDDYQKELEYIQFLQSKGYRVISPTR